MEDNTSYDPGMSLLDPFPSLMALGQERLQELCNAWLATPEAQELKLHGVRVGDASTRFAFYPDVQMVEHRRLDARIHSFVTSLLAYLATHGLPENGALLAERIHQVATVPPGMVTMGEPVPGNSEAHAEHFMGRRNAMSSTPGRRQIHPGLTPPVRPERVTEPPTFPDTARQ